MKRMVEAILPAIFIVILGLIASATLIPNLDKKTKFCLIVFLIRKENLIKDLGK